MATITGFSDEREGQFVFYNDFLKSIDSTLNPADVIADDNDGVLRGNLLEFKMYISDLNTTLFQSIKYLSALRIKGKPVPANILLISLLRGTAYLFKSKDYLEQIETVYTGASSRSNTGFMGGDADETLDYHDNPMDESRLIELLRQNEFTKINIDENCVVGWANSFYKLNPGAPKSAFIGDLEGKIKIIGEIRKPDVFKDLIYPYPKKTNKKFQYLMDRLNDDLQKKNLGAFYTPRLYADKALELVREAISRVPVGNDYIILDRSAGTGNLELGLTAEELSHVILSTIEYYEYKVLVELLADKVRHIIPPTEKEDTFVMGNVRGADALSEEYINNPVIKQYLENPKCTVILFENPPFAETTSAVHQKLGVGKKSSVWKNTFVVQEMKKEISGTTVNDLGNVFIWSAFKFYLRQPTDSYIVYSPVKYWKAQHLINKKFIKGFAFNRRHFHTSIDACIMCALWANSDEKLETLSISAFDIHNNRLHFDGELPVNRIHDSFSAKYYDKRVFPTDVTNGILTMHNGLELDKPVSRTITPRFNENILGYLVADSSGFDNPDYHACILVAGIYNGNGFYLRKDNYLEKLPMFATGRYITYNRRWTERARIMKSADGATRFHADVMSGKLDQFLRKVLLFTTLEMQNHMRSFRGSDGREYRNELCLDTTNGPTLASLDVDKLNLNATELQLIDLWDRIMSSAKATANYNPSTTYGVYQIFDELNTYVVDEIKRVRQYDYPDLQGHLNTLKALIRNYYNVAIAPVLFEYEFLK